MPLESIICRRKLDEQYGNPQICECPMCKERANSLNDGEGKDKEQEEISSPGASCEPSSNQQGGDLG